MITSVNIKRVDSNHIETIHIDTSSIRAEGGIVKQFSAFALHGENGEPMFIPYILSHDSSDLHKEAIHLTIDGVLTTTSAGIGYHSSYNAPQAMRKGLANARACGIQGARYGLLAGAIASVFREIYKHVSYSPMKTNYYISPYGPDYHGPIKLV